MLKLYKVTSPVPCSIENCINADAVVMLEQAGHAPMGICPEHLEEMAEMCEPECDCQECDDCDERRERTISDQADLFAEKSMERI